MHISQDRIFALDGVGRRLVDSAAMTDHPNFDSIEIMRTVDQLPKGWRKLVHEYGFKAVLGCREDGLSLADADDALWMARSARQAQWLSTQYITPKVARSYNV